jgi:hypothetical protein
MLASRTKQSHKIQEKMETFFKKKMNEFSRKVLSRIRTDDFCLTKALLYH